MACGAVVFWPGELFQAPLKYYKIQPLRSTMYIVTHIWFFITHFYYPRDKFSKVYDLSLRNAFLA